MPIIISKKKYWPFGHWQVVRVQAFYPKVGVLSIPVLSVYQYSYEHFIKNPYLNHINYKQSKANKPHMKYEHVDHMVTRDLIFKDRESQTAEAHFTNIA